MQFYLKKRPAFKNFRKLLRTGGEFYLPIATWHLNISKKTYKYVFAI